MFLYNLLKSQRLILIVTLLLCTLYNWSFFTHINQVYPILEGNLGFFISLSISLFVVIALSLCLLCFGWTTKPILILFILIASFSAYYMNSFDIVIDKHMIRNVIDTNLKEAADLFTTKLLIYALVLGLIPSMWIYRQKTVKTKLLKAFYNRVLFIILLLLLASQALIYSKSYSSFLREQKLIRLYITPLTPIYSSFSFLKSQTKKTPVTIAPLGRDARIPATDLDRELIILVVGETARADRFSLNGYGKQTNPHYSKKKML